MAQSTTILDQILNRVPKKLFDTLAEQHLVNKHRTVFYAKNHFAVMIFAQLTGLSSLRSIVHATSALFSQQCSTGLLSVKKSTLADANQQIDYRFYRELFFSLLKKYHSSFDRHKFPLPGKLLTLDSTTIKLCLQNFPWALFRSKSGGIKLHTLMDNNGNLPADIIMTEAKVHDIRPARKIEIIPEATYLLDRGYIDSKWLYKIHQKNAYFVTRWKINIAFAWTKSIKTDSDTGVIAEWHGYLDSKSRNNYPEILRIVKYVDPETKKKYWFLTNLMDTDAQIIADLYKQRWQIELFFKWIKQNLKIKSFLGTSENAVQSQVWIAMISYLLLRVLQKDSHDRITVHNLLIFIRTKILLRLSIRNAWKTPQGVVNHKIKKRKRLRTSNLLKFTGH